MARIGPHGARYECIDERGGRNGEIGEVREMVAIGKMGAVPAVRRRHRAVVALVGLLAIGGGAAGGRAARAAANPLALPVGLLSHGLVVNKAASKALSGGDVAKIADAATVAAFRQNGWQGGYEQRLEGAPGARVIVDAFSFADGKGARTGRAVWTATTPGVPTKLKGLPASAQIFQAGVGSGATAGWDVQVIFRSGRVFVDVDARVAGAQASSTAAAQGLAVQVTKDYNTWIAAHPLP